MNLTLETPIGKLPLIGPVYAKKLQNLKIETAEDLIYHFPFRYEDYSQIASIATVRAGEIVTVCGKIETTKNIYTKYGKKIQKAQISDATGSIEAVWYNQPFLVRNLYPGASINLSGKVGWFGKKLVMEVPDYEILNRQGETDKEKPRTIHTGRLVPIYPETYGISSKWLRSRIFPLMGVLEDQIVDHLPSSFLEKYNLLSLKEALCQIHFPQSKANAQKARDRLAFDELFLLQLRGLKTKGEWDKELVGHPFSIANYQKDITRFWDKIPFELTEGQKQAVKEIFVDLAKAKPMNRLLEGDVGSGKTVVASIAMYVCILNGYQSALMAPTEILAFQHFETISKILEPLGIKVALATGSRKLNTGEKFDIIIGTHALLSQKLEFSKLGLVVIDEQHRFGVEQRSILRQRGINPHLLTLTATPIPRTIALTLYGELDLSLLKELPPGRKRVKTWVVESQKRTAAYKWISEQIAKEGSSVFIICPLIEESETLSSVKAAKKEYEYLKETVFPEFRIGLLHGRMKGKEKESVISEFRESKFQILVATPVVEVGIDIPQAHIMLIEGAERFGLAQLHQLRGRVGRSEKQSYCLLFTEQPQSERLKLMEAYNSGAQLAEMDLKLRGPGEIYGTAQHGLMKLRVASFSDFGLIETTRKSSREILTESPNLDKYPLLQAKLKKVTITTVSPD